MPEEVADHLVEVRLLDRGDHHDPFFGGQVVPEGHGTYRVRAREGSDHLISAKAGIRAAFGSQEGPRRLDRSRSTPALTRRSLAPHSLK